MKKVIKWLLCILAFLQGSTIESMQSMLSRITTAARRNMVSSSLPHNNRVHVQRRFSDRPVEVQRQSHKQTNKNENFNSDRVSCAPIIVPTVAKPSFGSFGWIVASLCGLFALGGFDFLLDPDQQEDTFLFAGQQAEKIVKIIDKRDSRSFKRLLIPFLENIENDNPAYELVCKRIIGSRWACDLICSFSPPSLSPWSKSERKVFMWFSDLMTQEKYFKYFVQMFDQVQVFGEMRNQTFFKLCERDPNFISKTLPFVTQEEYFTDLISGNCEFLLSYMKYIKEEDCKQYFISKTLPFVTQEEYFTYPTSGDCEFLLSYVNYIKEEDYKQFIPLITEANIGSFDGYRQKLFLITLCKNKDFAKHITNVMNDNNMFNLEIWSRYMEHTSCDPEIEQKLHKDYNDKKHGFAFVCKLIEYLKNCKEHSLHDVEKDFDSMLSYKHIKQNIENIVNSSLKLDNPDVRKIVDSALKKEKELRDKGYHVFYHGQRSAYALPEELFTHIYGIVNKVETKDFLITHIKKPITGPRGLNKQRKYRKKLIREGNTKDSKADPEGVYNRSNALFLNPSLFHNIKQSGSNSVAYMIYNDNAGRVSISLKDVFECFNRPDIYEKLKPLSDTLEKDTLQLMAPYGQLLLVAIPKDKVTQMVYSGTSGGGKRKKYVDGVKTDNVAAILQALKNNPDRIKDADGIEMVGVTTWDEGGILNPASGVKIIPIHHVSGETLEQDVERDKKEYFDAVKREFEKAPSE